MSGNIECLVMHAYESKLEDELTLRVGDIITKVHTNESGWWHGRLGFKEGVFPKNHTRVLQGSDDEFGLETGPKYVVNYPYKPVREDELELVAGQVVVKVGELEPGCWKGLSRGRLGVFPSNFVSRHVGETDLVISSVQSHPSLEAHPISVTRSFKYKPVIASSPVVFRRNSSRVKSIHASLDLNTLPISANLFDPEDEPLGPLFGSLSSQLEQDWSTASLSSNSNTKPGLFARIRHSFSGRTMLPRFMSGRLSSCSLFDTRSACSPMMTRRNSFAAFFKRSPSAASSKQDLKDTTKTDRCTSPDLDTGLAAHLPGLKPLQSTPVMKLEGDFRKVSLSSDKKSASRETQQSLSWVWQEVGSKTSSKARRPFTSSGDSGVDDDGREINYEEPEDFFGPVEITDEVFDDMFNNSKKLSSMPVTPGFQNTDISEVLEEKFNKEENVTEL